MKPRMTLLREIGIQTRAFLFFSQYIKCWTNENNDAELNGLARTKLTSYGTKPTDKELEQWKDKVTTATLQHC